MKKAILIFALSRSPWIGGIYYRKNITHMLLSNEQVSTKYKIVVLTNESYKDAFLHFLPQIELVICKDKVGVVRAIFRAILCCVKFRVRYVFPLRPFGFLKIFGITPVSWIADFQHCYYPEFFSAGEVKYRNRTFKSMAEAGNPLVVSSNSALKDFKRFFSQSRNNIHVVHFTSYIDDELQKLKSCNEQEILKTFGLLGEHYVAICNQFWKHKNHMVVLKAIQVLQEKHHKLNLK